MDYQEKFDKIIKAITASRKSFTPSIPTEIHSSEENGLTYMNIAEIREILQKLEKEEGRHNGIGYIREEKLAGMFEEPVKKVTLNEEISEWLKEGLRESSKNTFKLQENRLNSLKNQKDKVNIRLSRLYDAKFDGEINEDIFQAKDNEYKAQIIEIQAQIDKAS